MSSKNAHLFNAIKNNKLEQVTALISQGINVNFEGEFKKTPLIYAIECNANKETVIQIIKARANVNAQDVTGSTPLMYAMQRNCDTEITLTLIKRGANINAYDKWGRTPLMYTTCIQCNKKTCKNKENALALLNSGANVKLIDCGGNTILHLEICSYLINLFVTWGASVDAKDNGGDTPLMTHVLRGNSIKVRTLLSVGANPNCRDVNLNTPIYNTRSDEIINMLLYYRAYLDTKNSDGKSPLIILFERGWINSGLAVLKHFLLYQENETDHYLPDIKSRFYNNIQNKLDAYRSELENMKKTNMTSELTFYDFCALKKNRFSNLVNVLESQYLYNNNEIKKMFPNYSNILIMKIGYNKIDKCKNDMMKNLENIIIKPLQNIEDDLSSTVELNYDCLYYISHFLNNKQLHTLLLASV